MLIPLIIKGILGAPSLATGWSHKYRMLFEDYGFGEGILDIMADEDEIRQKIDLIVEPDSRRQIQTTLNEKAHGLKQQSEQMWQDVIGVINAKSGGGD